VQTMVVEAIVYESISFVQVRTIQPPTHEVGRNTCLPRWNFLMPYQIIHVLSFRIQKRWHRRLHLKNVSFMTISCLIT
jgi:hypothetical protein